MDEMLNLRSFYLRLVKKIWKIPACILIGMIACGGIYFEATQGSRQDRTFENTVKLYLDFAYDEETGTQVDSYNAYTWNDLMGTDDIIDQIMSNLNTYGVSETESEKDSNGQNLITRKDVLETIDADIPSDVRLMVITITAKQPNLCDYVGQSVAHALVTYGENNDAFESIKILSISGPELVVVTDKTKTAVIAGGVLGLIVGILGMLLLEVLDDAVYVPEDLEKKYHLPVLGVIVRGGKAEPDYFRNQIIANAQHTYEGLEDIRIMSSLDRDAKKNYAESVCDRYKKILGNDFDFDKTEIKAAYLQGTSEKWADDLDTADGVIIAVNAGRKNISSITENTISSLHKVDVPILGMLLVDADDKFLQRYYKI